MQTGVIILAAGKGTRMQTEKRKQFLDYKGKPLFLHSVEQFLPFSDQIILVTGEEDIPAMEEALSEVYDREHILVTAGGKERYESSLLGIRALNRTGTFDRILIHDAARPFVTAEVIQRVISDVDRYGSGISAVPSVDTVKIVNAEGFVQDTPDRARVYAVQTPQGFRGDWITEAYECLSVSDLTGLSITDDAMVLETFTAYPVKITLGDYGNRKITVPEDLRLIHAQGDSC